MSVALIVTYVYYKDNPASSTCFYQSHKGTSTLK